MTGFILNAQKMWDEVLINADPRVEDWFMMSSFVPSLVICVLYVIIVLLGPTLMANRKPMNIKNVLLVYNLGMVALSTYIFIEFLLSGWATGYSLHCQPVDYSKAKAAMRMASTCWWFYISKFIELFDTIFFIMRKKFIQVSFLHVFHHGIMPISWWFGVKFVPGGFGTFHALLNSFIHLMMYTYYGLAALGPQYQKYLWWKKYMTKMQLKPILLHGHERSITEIKYNREGDLIFSCAKDHQPNVWYSVNGERLGSFKGHTGAVWNIDVSWDTTYVLTGSADNSCKLWDCQTGKMLSTMESKTAVRTCGFSYSGNLIMYTTDKTMGHPCEIHIYDINDMREPVMIYPIAGSKITSAVWGPYEEYIITGHENGELCHIDLKSGEKINAVHEHSKQINDIRYSKDMSMIITASKDTTAKLFDTVSLRHMKTYKTERPVNSAAISPIRDHVVLGGGQEAMEVTTTSSRVGKFDARFYHLVFEEEFGRVKGHFGPINSLSFHPDGKSYSSGGEDGFVRVHHFDPSYFEFRFDY